MVDAHGELIEIEAAGRGGGNVIRSSRARWRRKQRQEAFSLLAPERGRNLIVHEWGAERILERRGEETEVTAFESVERYRSYLGLLLAAILILPAHEEESFFLPDRAAQHQAVLIAMEGRFEWREEPAGVQRCIAMDLPGRAVKRVGPRPRGDDRLPAGLPAVLGRIGSGEDPELAHGVEDRPMQRLVRGLVVIVDTVQQILVGDFGAARHVKAASEAEIRAPRGRANLTLELGELKIVAAVNGQPH